MRRANGRRARASAALRAALVDGEALRRQKTTREQRRGRRRRSLPPLPSRTKRAEGADALPNLFCLHFANFSKPKC